MKLLVILENHFLVDNKQNVWCDRIIDYNFLKRYLNVFEKVIVCGRTIEKNNNHEDENFKLLVSGTNIEFRKLPNFYGIKGLLLNYFKINKLIQKYSNEADCVLYRAPTPISLFTYKTVLKSKKVLAVEFMFAADKMIEGKNIIKKIANKFISYKAKDICRKANGVSYVTEKTLQKKYPCTAMMKGETEEYFTESYSTIELENNNIIPKDWKKDEKPEEFKIIHTGYMDTFRKGQHVLIRALKIVRDKGYNVKLTLVGDGKRKKDFEELVEKLQLKNCVEFTGLIKDKQEIFSRLRENHLLVFPTEAEGLPRTIIEGMAVGLPCISSPVDGIPELLSKEYLVKNDDYNGYAHKIMELLDDWEKMIKISEHNFNKAKLYEKSKLESKRNDFYKKIKNLAEKRRNDK